MIPYVDRNFSVKDPNTTKYCNSWLGKVWDCFMAKKKGIKKEAKIKIIFKNPKQIKTKQNNHKQPNKKNTERVYTNRIQ